eukprot:1158588-Pelagomonas_calceolata.AAC.2
MKDQFVMPVGRQYQKLRIAPDGPSGEGPPPTPPTPHAHAHQTFFNPLEFHPPPSSAPRTANGYGRLGVHSLPLARIQRRSQPHVPPPRQPRPLAAPSYSPWEQEHRMHAPLEAHSYKPWEDDVERLSRPISRHRLRTQSAPLAKPSLTAQSATAPQDNPRRMRVHYQWRQQQYQMEMVNEQAQAAASVKERGSCLEWLQSRNLLFYDAMMAIDRKFLSKVCVCVFVCARVCLRVCMRERKRGSTCIMQFRYLHVRLGTASVTSCKVAP